MVEQELENTIVPRFQLFDLEKDPAEKTDVAAEFPEVTERLQRRLDEIIKQGGSRPGIQPVDQKN